MRREPRPPQADHHHRTRYMDGLPGLARERAHRSAVALASPSSRARARALSHRRIDAGTGADTGVAELQTAVHPRDGARSPDCSSSGRVQRAQGGDAPARERMQTLAVRSSAAGCSAPARRCTQPGLYTDCSGTAARRDALSAHRVGTHRRGNGCAELQCTRAVVHAARTAARRDALSAHGLGTRERVQALTAREPAHQECPGECPRSVSVRCETADKARH